MLRRCLPQWPLRWDGLRIHNQGCNEHRATSSGLVLRETFFSSEGQASAKPGRFTVYGRGPESFSSPPLYRRRPNGDFIFINHETKQQTKHPPKAFLDRFALYRLFSVLPTVLAPTQAFLFVSVIRKSRTTSENRACKNP